MNPIKREVVRGCDRCRSSPHGSPGVKIDGQVGATDKAAAHGVCRQHRQIHDYLEVVHQKVKGFKRSGYREVVDPFNTKVFADSGVGG
jgi:hypothetical protein